MSNEKVDGSPELRINVYYEDDKEKDLTTVRATKTDATLEIDSREPIEIQVLDIVADVDKPGDIVRKYIEKGLKPEQYRDVVTSRKKRLTLTGDKENVAIAKADEEWFKEHMSDADRMKIVRDAIKETEQDSKILRDYYKTDLSDKSDK